MSVCISFKFCCLSPWWIFSIINQNIINIYAVPKNLHKYQRGTYWSLCTAAISPNPGLRIRTKIDRVRIQPTRKIRARIQRLKKINSGFDKN